MLALYWSAIRQLRREHASVAGLARQFGVSWKMLWTSVAPMLAVLASDESRYEGVSSLGVDEHTPRASPPRRSPPAGSKELTGIVDLTPDQQGRVRARLLDLVPGRSG